jgi:hypothetical protein
MATTHGHTEIRHSETHDMLDGDDDRPSFVRVERFLNGIDERRTAARRTRWLALGVGGFAAGVAFLTALGVVPVEAENLVLSAGVVVAGFALGKD